MFVHSVLLVKNQSRKLLSGSHWRVVVSVLQLLLLGIYEKVHHETVPMSIGHCNQLCF